MSARLTLALDRGLAAVPTIGLIGVWGPHADHDLSALPQDRVRIIQGFRPDVDAWTARGYEVASAPGQERFGLSVVALPRSKVAARARIAAAMAVTDGPVLIDGAKSDGIDAVAGDLRARTRLGEVLSKAHGKIFAIEEGDLSEWADPGVRTVGDGFVTRPGVFSEDGPDPGSAALAMALPRRLGPRVADLGAGWGYLSRAILARDGVSRLEVVEADHAALDCARLNVTDPRAVFHWADARRFSPDTPVDTVVTNPPFHTGRAADPSLGRAFIEAGARILGPKGGLWLVANRHLPYEHALRAAFRSVTETGTDSRFKILYATHPKRQP